MRIRALALTCLISLLGVLQVPAAEASSIFTATVKVVQSNGKPLDRAELTLLTQSSSGSKLTVIKLTDSKGEAKVQAYPGEYTLWFSPSNYGNARCLQTRPSIKGTLSAAEKLIRIVTPNVASYTFTVSDSNGKPTPGIQVELRGSSLPLDFGCNVTGSKTDSNGVAILEYFEEPVWTEPDRAAVVTYSPFEGTTLLRELTPGEVSAIDVGVVLDDIPSADLIAPASVKSGQAFSLSGNIFDSEGSLAKSSKTSFQMASTAGLRLLRSQFKKVELWGSTLQKGKWSSWKKTLVTTVPTSGTFSFGSVRQVGASKYQVRGVGFSLASKVKLVSLRK